MTRIQTPIKTIFITGISVSGKTTLGERLEHDLIEYGFKNVQLLDGEEVRKMILKKTGCLYGYSNEDRNAVSMEILKIAIELNMKGFICIICAISHIKRTREKMRRKMGNFMEVYLDCSVETCAQRDYKGHYQKAFEGLYDNFIGVTEPYQVSENPELILDTAKNTIEECSEILFQETIRVLCNPEDVIMETDSKKVCES